MTLMVQLALLLSVPVIVMLYLTQKPHVAAASASIFGVLLLPAARGFDLPLLPTLDQSALPSLISGIMLCAVCWPMVARAKIGRGPEICLVFIVLAGIATNLTNTDAQVFGTRVLSGMQPFDIINDALVFVVVWGLPFLIGRVVTRSTDELRDILMILVWGGLLYIPLASMELLVGPNLHNWVYGDHPNPYTYSQQLKFGGLRPVVFMVHGLNFALFMFVSAAAALILSKVKQKVMGAPIFPIAVALIVMLLPARTVGVWVFALIALPLIAFTRPRVQATAAVVLAVLVFSYPALRAVGVVPVDQMYAIAEEYAGEKAANSLFSRLLTEDEILERTQERLMFGWGGYGRFQIFDPFTGESLSILDGFWVIIIGEGGAVRVMLMFSFLLLPVLSAYRALGRVKSESARRMISGLALVMALRAADMIPNTAGAEGYLTFLCGALSGAVRGEVTRRTAAPIQARAQAPTGGQERDRDESAWPDPQGPPLTTESSGSASLGMLASKGPPVRRRTPDRDRE